MRVVCISDTHGRHRDICLPQGDILIHAGDITHFGKEHQLLDFNEWLGELPFTHKVVIAGNHECNNTYDVGKLITNGVYLDGSSTTVEGVKIFGIKFFPDSFAGSVPAATDIVVSHNPPCNIGDGLNGKASGTGCKLLLREVQQKKPKLHVFGHVHSGYGLYTFPDTPLSGTTFVNAAICGGPYNYALTNPPIIVDL